MTSQPNVTERQAKYFASLQASLESATGKSLEEWVAIARTCPETGHRARLKWFKEHHGLLQNRASHVLSEAFGTTMSWREPDSLIEALWTDTSARAVFEAIDILAMMAPDAVRTARKGYTAWSRTFQFAAAKPLKGGYVMLGLAVPISADLRLESPKNESWSERLKARLRIETPGDVDGSTAALLRLAWENS